MVFEESGAHGFGSLLKIILTTLTPHIRKKYAPKICHKMTFTENVVHEPTFMAYELRLLWHTNPPFMPYEPFLLGVRVVSNLLTYNWSTILQIQSCSRLRGNEADILNCGWLTTRKGISFPLVTSRFSGCQQTSQIDIPLFESEPRNITELSL